MAFNCQEIDLVSTEELDIVTGARDGGVCSSGEVLREEYNRYMSVQTHGFGQPGRSYIGNIRTLIPSSEPPSEGTFLIISVIFKALFSCIYRWDCLISILSTRARAPVTIEIYTLSLVDCAVTIPLHFTLEWVKDYMELYMASNG